MIARCWRWLLLLLLLLLLGITPGGQAAPGAEWMLGWRTRILAVITDPAIALILLGIAFMIAEAFLPSVGVVGFAGIVAFVVGAMMLIDSDATCFGIPLALIGTLAVLCALLIGGVLGMALKARQRALVSGDAGLVGSLVTVTQVMAGNPLRGAVLAQGEEWQVQCATPLHAGQNVRVTARHGVMLDVSAAVPAAKGE